MKANRKVLEVAHQSQIPYAEAEDLLRGRAGRGEADAKSVIDQIDADRARERAAALALTTASAERLGLDLDGLAKLVATLAADPKLETWLCRRVQLAVARGEVPAHDYHPTNE